MRITWGILAVSVLALTGCATATSASPSASAKTPAPSPTTTTKAEIGESICKDEAADSTAKTVDIDQVRLLSDGKLMFMTFNTVADVPTTGRVLYSVTAWSPDGKTGYQFGTKFQNGKETDNFVFNISKAKQENITNGAVAADKQVSARYPLAQLAGLGDKFSWSATVTVDGTDVDRCPGGEAKTQFPNT
ncbi:hypothetical protein NG701_20265 [Pseudarthrobacter sp. HLT3-5]|uniref:hypothetical protein n=1 Tax=Pseudarthrobacter cellobiosi TaxID=2953654 RepID=UPI00208EAD8B|nr:hypothetical protein [Pseudarthrobacter sp. HLT3-5]MCO4276721.1 hypothetical protein [Pseudarthrobacter sp. HLT3-5]